MISLLEPAVAPATTMAVVDNAKYAWNDSTQACLAALPADFVADYRDLLDAAAITAMELELPAVWAKYGYRVEWGSYAQLESGEDRAIANELYWRVWEEAADRLDGHALAAAAELNDELNGYKELDD